MNLNPEILARVYIIVFILVCSTVLYGVYQQVVFVRKQRRDLLQNFQDDSDNFSTTYLDLKFRSKIQDIQEILKIKDIIKNINIEQTMYNKNWDWIPNGNVSFIVVIQVHSNEDYLRQLLLSLNGANGINKALLIFSHDFYSHNVNQLIKRVKFAPYIQIYYPYSIQLHPNVFPGRDEQYCTEGYVCKKSDLRDPEAAQAKHHWWWGANQVFDHMEITQHYNGTILFLEEGNYMTEDFLYISTLLRLARKKHCPFCEVLSLGAHKPVLSQYNKKTVISVEVWTKEVPRAGIAFNRQIWKALKSSSNVFCYYDDFNWDSSFRHVSEQKWEGSIYMTAVSGPRVFRLGECGSEESIHNMTCKEHDVYYVDAFIKQISKNLYPWGMIMVVYKEKVFEEEPAGLWGDVRDHELCMHFSKKSTWY